MAFIFRQKLNLMELVPLSLPDRVVLVMEPEEYLQQLYCKYLKANGFSPTTCIHLDLLHQLAKKYNPEVIILNIDAQYQFNKINQFFRQLFSTAPKIKVITVGYDASTDTIKKLMSLGVSGHVDRRFSEPEDIIFIINSLQLKNNY